MSPSTVTDLLDSFITAPRDRLDPAYRRLTAALWDGGRLTDAALPAAVGIVARLAEADEEVQGHLALLLGLLVEAEYPATDGEVTAAVREGLPLFLDLLGRCRNGQPLTLALLYLLSHFPDDRDRVLAVAAALSLDEEDRTRLDRSLLRLDPDNAVLGRVWPSPSAWRLSEEERGADLAWVRSLSPEQIAATWQSDTRSVFAQSGAKAHWALRHGTPRTVADPDYHVDASEEEPAAAGSGVFGRHRDVLRCPACHGRLLFDEEGARCSACRAEHPVVHGVLDLSWGVAEPTEKVGKDVLQHAAVMRKVGLHYETGLRPGFLRVMGSNWGGAVTPADEDRYLAEHVRPAAGPVLDLAAGGGRWTSVLARWFGADRVIALDLNASMLLWLRRRLPDVAPVRGSALALPFGDASLGAVNCWNSLQAIPDPAAVIAEASRCLRPGGTFTAMTFLRSPDPVYRYFQTSISFPNFPEGMPLFAPGEVRAWLEDSGMAVREETTVGTFLFLTAERTG